MTRIYVSNYKDKVDEEALKMHFQKFGEISDIFQPTDSNGNFRGFAYITFKKIYKQPWEDKHVINGCELYIDRDAFPAMSKERSPALMVSGTLQNVPNYTLQKHFSQYGLIIDIFRKFDSQNKRFMRYAFILYASCDSVEKAMQKPLQVVNGELLNLRKATNFEVHGKVVEEHPKINEPVKSIALDPRTISKYRIIPIDETLTLEVLKDYFNQYGKVLDFYVPKVYGTNRNKDYAYVTLGQTLDKPFIKQGWHIIAGKETRIELEVPFNVKIKSSCLVLSASPKFISKISEADIKNHFKQYGKIKEIRKPTDTIKKTMLHCAFIEFKTTDAVDKAIGKNIKIKIIFTLIHFFIEQPVCIINNLPFSVAKAVHEQYRKGN